MGGSVNVAIRLKNGEAFCVERWTNNIPFWLINHEMYVDDKHAVKYLSMTLENDPKVDKYCTGKPQRLCNSSYGIIIFDYVTNTIIDNNEYSHLNRISSISSFERGYSKDMKETKYKIHDHVKGLIEAGRIKDILKWNNTPIIKNPTKTQVYDFLEKEKHDRFEKSGYLMINTNPMMYCQYPSNHNKGSFKLIKKHLKDINFPMNKSQGLNKTKWIK